VLRSISGKSWRGSGIGARNTRAACTTLLLCLVAVALLLVFNLREPPDTCGPVCIIRVPGRVGVAFVVPRKGLVTAWHCVSGSEEAFTLSNTGAYVSLSRPKWLDPAKDIAVFTLPRGLQAKELAIADTPGVGLGEEVDILTTSGVMSGRVAHIRRLPTYGVLYGIDVSTPAGVSGSPVVNRNQQVVGVASFTNNHLLYASSIPQALKGVREFQDAGRTGIDIDGARASTSESHRLLREGKVLEALDQAADAVRKNPDGLIERIIHATCLRRAERVQEALAVLRPMEAETDPAFCYEYALCLFDAQSEAEAERVMRRCVAEYGLRGGPPERWPTCIWNSAKWMRRWGFTNARLKNVRNLDSGGLA
jgi:hypothetical protein